MQGVDFLHGQPNALFKWNEGFANGGLTDETDNAGGNGLIGLAIRSFVSV
jgi:hypothetical protein